MQTCEFIKQSVEYLGHFVDSLGLHTMPAKVEAIQQAPELENVQQLTSFLNYYGKFNPSLASIIHPLNQLLQKDTKWQSTQNCAKAFSEAKQALKLS